MSGGRVAVVTGSNKGIGYAIVRGLCKQFDGDVYLTARDEGRGNEAVKSFNKEGLKPKFHQLDISDTKSIQKFSDFLKSHYGGIDILVNNAAIAYKSASTAPFSEQAKVTCGTNFTGTLNVCNLLFPLLRPHARVCNVSSMACKNSFSKCSPAIQTKLKNPSITMAELEAIIQDFIKAAKTGIHTSKGYSNSAYGMSKIGVTVMSQIQQREMHGDPREDIVINACCPGWVNTDMSSNRGSKTIDQGADTPLYLSMLPPGIKSPNGNMVSDRNIRDWTSG